MSRILAFSFVLLLAANALGQKVSASLDRAATSVGESVTLSITCTNFTPSSQPMLPSIRGLRFSSGGTSRKFQLGSGGRTSTYTYKVQVTPLQAGTYTIHWDGRATHGLALASGVYLYRLRAGEQVGTRRLLLLK